MIAEQHILIVDDNDGFTRTMAMILKKNGYDVVIARDGIEALEKVKEGTKFNLIFMDVIMPRMNGVETFRHIRVILPEVLVVMMTGYAVDDLIQEALCNGAYSVIHKPFDFDSLISLIERAKIRRPLKQILILDDNKSFNETFKNILARRGFRVHSATQGDEAIEKIKSEGIDLVFLDMKLPESSGLQVFNSMKQIQPDIAVIVITAYEEEMQGNIAKVLLNHGYASLRKPLAMKDLYALLEDLFGSSYSSEI